MTLGLVRRVVSWGRSPGAVEPTHCPGCGAELLPSDGSTTLDRDQTASDRDQTASDGDQTASDRDQTASDRDQESAADDQEAADHDLAEGSDPVAYERSKLARGRTAHERLHTSEERDQAAESRDRNADVRHDAAGMRDRLTGLSRGGAYLRAEKDRARAAADRAAAARDRERAARDREHAASLRAESARDRALAAQERKLAGIDQLTGVSLRSAGLAEVERELQRARRTGTRLVMAFVDIDNLKAVNDSEGHLAGDSLLRQVADTLRAKLRPYDVIVRFGGDEFVCVLPDADTNAVRQRFEDVVETLKVEGRAQPISFGLAELEQDDDLERLLARADGALLGARRSNGHRSG